MTGHRVAPVDANLGPDQMEQGEAVRSHLESRLAILRTRVLDLVEARRAEDPKIEDPFRGLYIDESQIETLHDRAAPARPDPALAARLSEVERLAEAAVAGGRRIVLRRLADESGLDALDLELYGA